MSIELEGTRPQHVYAQRVDPKDPTRGYDLTVGDETVTLTPEQADTLGRYLLFDDSTTD